ncbi:MAG: hypothetical protein RIC16_05685 [Rhodospirillales bacterium]
MDQSLAGIGHNSVDAVINVEVKFFNSLHRHRPADDSGRFLTLPAGSTVGNILSRFSIAEQDVFLVFRNGRDITPGLVGDAVRSTCEISDGDVIALSGPVPYSFGYGAPVV